jgi:hypothetical protein
MALNKSSDANADKNVQDRTEAYYEQLASQEEIYLEEIEERGRTVLISDSASPSERRHPGTADCVTEQLEHAAEELVAGDSDDPPLAEDEITKMLKADC